jgi:hypothetical protein
VRLTGSSRARAGRKPTGAASPVVRLIGACAEAAVIDALERRFRTIGADGSAEQAVNALVVANGELGAASLMHTRVARRTNERNGLAVARTAGSAAALSRIRAACEERESDPEQQGETHEEKGWASAVHGLQQKVTGCVPVAMPLG